MPIHVLQFVLVTAVIACADFREGNVVFPGRKYCWVLEKRKVDGHGFSITCFWPDVDLFTNMDKTPENLKLLQEFTAYVIEQLQIQSNAKIIFLFGHDPNYPSAGGYLPGKKTVVCAVKNRAIADVMRTLAHELTHHRQYELGMIGPGDMDNQKLEDQANVYAGRLVRWFGREHKEIYGDLG